MTGHDFFSLTRKYNSEESYIVVIDEVNTTASINRDILY